MGCCQSTLCCCQDTKVEPEVKRTPTPPPPPPPPPPPLPPPPIPFTRKAFSSEDQSLLIDGYKEETCTELREALRPFQSQIKNLEDKITEAYENCYRRRKVNHSDISNEFSNTKANSDDMKDKLSNDNGPVTPDEAAAIYMYTKRDSQDSTYHRLQTALESEDLSQIRLWFKYLNLLKRALDKIGLKNVKSFQCVVSEVNFLRWELQIITVHMCISEASPEKNKAEKCFAEKYPGQKMANIIYDNVPAYDVSDYSANDYPEYMLWPGVKLNIYKSKQVDGIFNFHLRVTDNHFACPIRACRNRCNRAHSKKHYCHGCVYLKYNPVRHRCKKPKCGYGDAETFQLYKCRECSGQFCIDCAMTGRDPSTFRCQSSKT